LQPEGDVGRERAACEEVEAELLELVREEAQPGVLACFNPLWPNLIFAVARFESRSGLDLSQIRALRAGVPFRNMSRDTRLFAISIIWCVALVGALLFMVFAP